MNTPSVTYKLSRYNNVMFDMGKAYLWNSFSNALLRLDADALLFLDRYDGQDHSGNMYYDLFKKIAKDEQREEYVITHIYASLDVSPANGETTDQWCERTGTKKCDTIK